MMIDLSNCPPVPPEWYGAIRELALSGQLSAERLVELLDGDPVFKAWWQQQANEAKKA